MDFIQNLKISVLLVISLVIAFTVTPAKAELQVVLSDANLVFRAEQGSTSAVAANTVIRVNVESDIDNWSVNYQAQALTGTAGNIQPGNILIRSPYTQGYQPADTLRLAATGDPIYTLWAAELAKTMHRGFVHQEHAAAPKRLYWKMSTDLNPSITPTVRIESDGLTSGNKKIQAESILVNNNPAQGVHTLPANNILKFSVQTGWGNQPGTYTGQVRFIFTDSSEQTVQLSVEVSSYTFLSLSPDKITFTAPRPGTHNADQTVDLKVGASVPLWSVKAEGEPLRGVNVPGSIPSNRIFIKSIPKGSKVSAVPGSTKFQDLRQERLLVKGTSREPSVASELSFQFKTLITDPAGDYRGKIRFTLLENP